MDTREKAVEASFLFGPEDYDQIIIAVLQLVQEKPELTKLLISDENLRTQLLYYLRTEDRRILYDGCIYCTHSSGQADSCKSICNECAWGYNESPDAPIHCTSINDDEDTEEDKAEE